MSGMKRHLNAAIGYLESGMLDESAGELENLPPEDPLCGFDLAPTRALW